MNISTHPILAAAILIVVLSPLAFAEDEAAKPFPRAQLHPPTDVQHDEDFQTFYENFNKAVECKDVDALLAVISPDIKFSFGAEHGVEDFKKNWNLDEKPEDSPIWFELSEMTRLGGTYQDYGGAHNNYFVVPYVFTGFPNTHDAFEFEVITGSGVRVRETPSLDAKIVRAISYEVVRPIRDQSPPAVEDSDSPYHWQQIALHDGTTGYVWSKYLRSPIGFRAGFKKENDQWRIVFFLAGD